MKTYGAAQAKTHFLSLLKDVERKREPILVTKNGIPVAKVVPLESDDDPLAIYRFGGIEIVGDIMVPSSELDDWEYD